MIAQREAEDRDVVDPGNAHVRVAAAETSLERPVERVGDEIGEEGRPRADEVPLRGAEEPGVDQRVVAKGDFLWPAKPVDDADLVEQCAQALRVLEGGEGLRIAFPGGAKLLRRHQEAGMFFRGVGPFENHVLDRIQAGHGRVCARRPDLEHVHEPSFLGRVAD